MDDSRGNLVQFDSEEGRKKELMERLYEEHLRRCSEATAPLRRVPIPFDVGEVVTVKGGRYEVEKIEPKRLTLKPLPRQETSNGNP